MKNTQKLQKFVIETTKLNAIIGGKSSKYDVNKMNCCPDPIDPTKVSTNISSNTN